EHAIAAVCQARSTDLLRATPWSVRDRRLVVRASLSRSDQDPKTPQARVRCRKGSSGGQLTRSGIPEVPTPRLTYAGPMRGSGYQPATNRGPAPHGTIGGRKGKRIWPPWVCPARQRAKNTEGPRIQSKTAGAWER